MSGFSCTKNYNQYINHISSMEVDENGNGDGRNRTAVLNEIYKAFYMLSLLFIFAEDQTKDKSADRYPIKVQLELSELSNLCWLCGDSLVLHNNQKKESATYLSSNCKRFCNYILIHCFTEDSIFSPHAVPYSSLQSNPYHPLCASIINLSK